MSVGAKSLAGLLRKGDEGLASGLVIVPRMCPDKVQSSGEASLTLRLGRWFSAQRLPRRTHLEVYNTKRKPIDTAAELEKTATEKRATEKEATEEPDPSKMDEKMHFVPFGSDFVLHPNRFVLGVTLEWITLPGQVSGSVTGKSYVGRRGLIIETAALIHPHFNGCLTLELANVGETPLRLRPGMPVCQLFLDRLHGRGHSATERPKSGFSVRRRPTAGEAKDDKILRALSGLQSNE